VADLYVVDFSGGEEEQARQEAEREAERARLHGRYVRHLAARAGVDEPAARRVIAALFDHADREGRRVRVRLPSPAVCRAWRWLRLPVHVG
jgi:hypothetical protein